MSSIEANEHHGMDVASAPSLWPGLATTQPGRREPPWVENDDDGIELKLGFRELDLIQRSLETVRTLGLVGRQDELLTDTLQRVDVALEELR
jgi:hypothetical protein